MQKQQSAGGGVLSFLVDGDQAQTWSVLNACQLFSKTAKLGGARSTITHPLTTTHALMPEALKAKAGIKPNLLRIAVGLEFRKLIWLMRLQPLNFTKRNKT